jgi:3-hydroxyacyl-CoA dehydrogenase
MTKRSIKKVAVLGSGVMGSRIACHFANVGCEVLLLDIRPERGPGQEQDRQRRAGLRAQEQPLAHLRQARFAKRISTGNFDR